MSVGRTWPFAPSPVPGEILSSYLARIAYAHGLNPRRFYSHFFQGIPIWKRDVDRHMPDAAHKKIAAFCHLSQSTVAELTLQALERIFSGGRSRPFGFCPWINVVGAASEKRRRPGMQYCLECLREEPIFRRSWRLSYVTVCEKHHIPLADCCQFCEAPVVYCRADSFGLCCFVCGRRYTNHRIVDEDTMPRIALQGFFDRAQGAGLTKIGHQSVEPHDLFAGAAFLLNLLKCDVRSKRRTKSSPAAFADMPTGQIEFMRLAARAAQCAALHSLLFNWPDQFLLIADMRRLAVSVNEKNAAPAWLHAALDQLPAKHTRGKAHAVSPVRQKLRKIHREKAVGWRARRATLLLNAASAHI